MSRMYLVAVAFAVACSAMGSVAAAEPPESGHFKGIVKTPSGFVVPTELDLQFASGRITGMAFSQFGSMVRRDAVSGTYENGQCNALVSGLTFIGPCSGKRFSGEERDHKKVTAIFDFVNVGSSADAPSAPATVAQHSATGSRPELPSHFKMDAPSDGFFDYFPGDDVSMGGEAEPASSPRPAGGAALDAPAGTLWAYGRLRWVVQPTGGCGGAELIRGYCFGAVIGYLRSHPKDKSVTAVALTRPAPLGTFISTDTAIRYAYVEVSRQGLGFKADKHLTGRAKVRMPPGCHFSPLKEGFILAAPGPRGLQEAALFQCS